MHPGMLPPGASMHAMQQGPMLQYLHPPFQGMMEGPPMMPPRDGMTPGGMPEMMYPSPGGPGSPNGPGPQMMPYFSPGMMPGGFQMIQMVTQIVCVVILLASQFISMFSFYVECI